MMIYNMIQSCWRAVKKNTVLNAYNHLWRNKIEMAFGYVHKKGAKLVIH